ncbi:lysine methyltransferase METTL21D [Micractinium conductrix]|uniref:Lysine methyltransferase METTL21D n=1 Tax=Micractinium conductrix TaxID=554055 RepID=A0A2P6VQY5_9CHLO|nr:lysine methyltransferase METTL21D [Micractinium conductrix]|eukprot:PSC76504.1 lysine methyltransferase METTL21D [Micractinium conductrix]
MPQLQFELAFQRWEDGERVRKVLHEPNRWEVHSAEEVAVTLDDLRLRILQQPHQLAGAGVNPDKLGVAAALWDGALVLAAYLVAQPRYRYLGMRCVELGAGVGLVGLALAAMGARVTITDVGKVLPLMRDNLAANGYHPARGPQEGCGWAEADALEWGKPGWMEGPVARLASGGLDLVVAADCCYIDQDGASPSTPAFVQTCAGLCGPDTRCLVAFERRAPEVRTCLLEEAKKFFKGVRRVPLGQVPRPLRLEYVDIWELTRPL